MKCNLFWTNFWWLNPAVTGLETLKPFVIGLGGTLATLLFATRTHIGIGLDIGLDVISHFKRPEPSGLDVVRQRWTKRGASSTYDNWVPLMDDSPAEWDAMIGRFRDVTEAAIRSSPGREIMVLAHSQGTMIALEALGVITIDRSGDAAARRVSLPKEGGCKISLVTMGCPFGDLYAHYFPGTASIEAPTPLWPLGRMSTALTTL